MKACLVFLFSILLPVSGPAYSVLTHEAIVDTLWADAIRPTLKQRFPAATEEELDKAHAYAYGGCIIQDLGYYPFGSHLFSDLAHYVRSADFVQALLDEAADVEEYAFALGATAHYGADVDGHAIAVNRAVPLLFPKLRRKFGDEVTYADSPSAHLKTEFGFDVLQVARGHYAPRAYHDFIGFEVAKDLLDRAFRKTYGLRLKDLFLTLDLALGTYRFSVSTLLPHVTRAAWALKKDEILKDRPTISRKQFLYNIKRASYRKEWGDTYERPGIIARFIAFLSRVMPRFGPFQGLAFRVPTPATEKMFEDSFNASVNRDRESFAEAARGELKIVNRDLDTGKLVREGEYQFTDRTYDRLLVRLAGKKFEGVTPELKANIRDFYGRMKTPDRHGIQGDLDALMAYTPALLQGAGDHTGVHAADPHR
ncbi:MAG: zinc dependent phospholipase C family protein [Acidobacteriota bacterium]